MLTINIRRAGGVVDVEILTYKTSVCMTSLDKGELQELAQTLDIAAEEVADAMDWMESIT